jgi:hypothetical protein
MVSSIRIGPDSILRLLQPVPTPGYILFLSILRPKFDLEVVIMHGLHY